MKIDPYLHYMAEKDASDLFLTTGAPASIKIQGEVVPVADSPLKPGVVLRVAEEIMNEEQCAIFEATKEMNLGLSIPDVGRFRVNIYMQRGEASMVIRYISSHIPAIDTLYVPPVLKKLVMYKSGLVLMVGATGTGKSTTLASMIDYRNTVKSGHILSIEDPIEFTFTHKKSIIGQREVGIDTMSYQSALREAMREAPDVIMIGEIRDPETMQAALNFADTGHLVLSTLHAVNSNQALDRIINLFPTAARNKILQDLSLNLRSIVSQRLIKGVEAKRVPAVEVLINSPFVAELIVQGKIGQIKDIMEKSASAGMQTFDQSLLELFEAGNISREEALANADSRNNLEWRMNFGGGTPDTSGKYARPVESDATKNSGAEIVAEDGEEPAAKESVLDDLKPFSTVKVDRRAR